MHSWCNILFTMPRGSYMLSRRTSMCVWTCGLDFKGRGGLSFDVREPHFSERGGRGEGGGVLSCAQFVTGSRLQEADQCKWRYLWSQQRLLGYPSHGLHEWDQCFWKHSQLPADATNSPFHNMCLGVLVFLLVFLYTIAASPWYDTAALGL